MTGNDSRIHYGVWRMIAIAAIAAGLAACANAQPYKFTAIDEIPPGPGLFSGEDGEFVLFGR